MIERAFQKLSYWKIHHGLFWILYFIFWTSVYTQYYEDIYLLYKVTTVYTISHATTYYLSQYVLIPRLLKKKFFFQFFLTFLLLCLTLGLMMFFTFKYLMGMPVEIFFNSSTPQIIIFFTTSNIFTGGALLAIKSFVENRKMIRRNETMEKQRLESELQYLKSQVNPHFLFNAINSVYVLIKIDPNKASETLIKLSNILRAQLYEFSTDTIDIKQELDYLENYIELEKIRKGERLDLTMEFEGELENFRIAPLVLIPFLENCFKHLSTHVDQPNKVKVRIRKTPSGIDAHFFNTCDAKNGVSRSHVGGIGLQNIKRRLDLIYPNKHQLEIKNLGDSFQVDLSLHLDQN